MKRRGFLSGIAALAGIAVLPSIPAAQVRSEQARLAAAFATGIVEDQTFYMDGPIVLDNLQNVIIRRCEFIWLGFIPKDESLIKFSGNCQNVAMYDLKLDVCKGWEQ